MKESLPSITALTAFESAARNLSFQNASQELYLTPSAISHQIRSLEKLLGSRLFNRLDKQVRLTRDGEIYFKQIQQALKKIESATNEIKRKEHDTTLKITSVPSFATRWLFPRLYKFQEANPYIDIQVHVSTEILDLAHSPYDVALRFGLGKWPSLESHLIGKQKVTPMCSPALLSNKRSKIRKEDLKNFLLIQVENSLDDWKDWFEKYGIKDAKFAELAVFQSTAYALEAAMSGIGFVLAERRLAQPELQKKLLIAPFTEEMETTKAFYLVHSKNISPTSNIFIFLDWLLEEVQSDSS